jgi:hypothetical protein
MAKTWSSLLACAGLLAAGVATAQEAPNGAPPPSNPNSAPNSTDDQDILRNGGKQGGTDTRSSPSEEDTAVTYSNIGLSRVSTDFDNLKNAVNLDLGLGLRVPKINWVSAELDFDLTVIEGDNTSQSSGGCGGPLGPPCPSGGGKVTSSSDPFQMQNIGAYIVLRNPGPFYFMGKYGYRYLQTSVPEIDQAGHNGTSYALGLGWRWGKGLSGVELGYTHYDSDINGWGFNINYGFGGR